MEGNVPIVFSHGQALPPDTRLQEFVIEKVLGSGGFGITYMARDDTLGRRVVIKENLPVQFCWRETHFLTVKPRQETGDDAENFQYSLESFRREAATLASLDHPGIVKVLRSFEANGTAYFVMPFVEGTALDEVLRQRMARNEGFEWEETEVLLAEILDVLGYLHDRGIYHRDIKPGNILLTGSGNAVLIDFGAARQRLSERSLTVIESAGYTPFEQLQSQGRIGPWSDIYALGGTLYKMLTGETPAKAADRVFDDPCKPLVQRPDLAGRYAVRFLESIDRAMAPKAGDRFQDAAQWREYFQTAEQNRAPSHPMQPAREAAAPDALVPPQQNHQTRNQISRALSRKTAKRFSMTLKLLGVALGIYLSACMVVVFILDERLPKTPQSVQPDGSVILQPVVEADPATELVKRLERKLLPVPGTDVSMSKTELTVGEWKLYLRAEGYLNAEGQPDWKQPSKDWIQTDDHPVVLLRWDRVKQMCDWLGQMTGRTWRFPTNAEWEAAVGKTAYPWGEYYPPHWNDGNYGLLADGKNDPERVGLDGIKGTAPVGSFTPNSLGFYDLGGNVWEWMWDEIDPRTGVPILRGGGWALSEGYCRVSARSNYGPGFIGDRGFRLVRGGTLALKANNVGLPSENSGASGVVKTHQTAGFVRVNAGALPAVSPLGSLPVRAFFMAKTEVTWGEWQTVRTWAAAHGYPDLASTGRGEGEHHPVTFVTWYDAVKWCNARSEKEGRIPVYSINGMVYRTGRVSPDINSQANGYRLPTEAEWEFAARGGGLSRGYAYSGSDDLNEVGWFFSNNPSNRLHEVGMKKANELGIYDMSGGVWEWCESAHPSLANERILRGGDRYDFEQYCRVGYRGRSGPGSTFFNAGRGFGLRVAFTGDSK